MNIYLLTNSDQDVVVNTPNLLMLKSVLKRAMDLNDETLDNFHLQIWRDGELVKENWLSTHWLESL